MPNNPDQTNQTPDSPQAFEDMNIVHNGKTYNNSQELPPEVKQKLQEAMNKLRQNPGLFNMIGGLAGLAKTANQLGITRMPDLNSIINSTSETNIETPSNEVAGAGGANQTSADTIPSTAGADIHNAGPGFYRQLNNQRNSSPTFNPAVKGDGLRKFIFVVISAGIIGYLIYQYGFQGKLPF